jgi:hypothetical protein
MQLVKQSVQIADDLVGQFQVVVSRITAAALDKYDMDMSSLRAEAERLYTAVWEHLDLAAAHTRNAGRRTDAYAAVRAGVDVAVGVAGVQTAIVDTQRRGDKIVYTTQADTSYNGHGVASAREASAALKAAWSDIDWTPPAPMPDVDLRPRGWIARLFGR